MQRISFDLGESRHVKLLIKSADSKPFVIRNASWELTLKDQIESQGECLIEEHIVDAFITPTKKGVLYRLRVNYQVADETLIEAIEVAVV
jgi:hypothetical protein